MLDITQIATLDFGGGNACSPEEYRFLGSLVALTAPASILEIGTSTGIGAFVMASAAAAGGGRPCRVTSIDLPFGRATYGAALARNAAAVNAIHPGLSDAVEFIVEDSRVVLPRLAAEHRQFDFVFIDGGHTYDDVRRDWDGVLPLAPDTIVLHDTVHLSDVARFVEEIAGEYPGVTITYPWRAVPGRDAGGVDREGYGPGFTIFSGLAHIRQARAQAGRRAVPAVHEVAARLADERILEPRQLRRAFHGHAFARTEPPAATTEPIEVEIIVTGRNDGYGGEDFHERMVTAAAFNHTRLAEAGVRHRFTLVEWNPPADRPLLTELLRQRLPWWHRSLVVSPAWHEWLCENPRLPLMEFFAKNAGIRRARSPWVLTTNSDVFLSREIVERLAAGRLEPGTLYRAPRLDMDRTMPWRDMSWALLEDPRYLLRRLEPEPPFYGEAAGDFLLLDRESYHALRGFNERIRFARIYKDGQFCIQAHHRGLAFEIIGPAYHLDHDGSYVNARHQYKSDFSDAHFGPRWDFSKPYWNREDWGLSAACEIDDEARGVTWLRTPEEAGPSLSLVMLGTGDAGPRLEAVRTLTAAAPQVEMIVVNAGDALAAALRAEAAPGVRLIDAPRPTAGAALAAGMAHARGRHLAYLPGPAAIDRLGALLARLELDAAALATCRLDPPAPTPFTVLSRRAHDRLDGLDPLAADWAADLYHRAASAFAESRIEDVVVRLRAVRDPAAGAIETVWAGLLDRPSAAAREEAGSRPIPAVLAADFQRRADQLEAALSDRLQARLPANADTVAVWGVGPLTALAVAALRALGRHVPGIYAPDADGSLTIAGLPVRPAHELDATDGRWVASAAASPADAIALLRQVPAANVVHLVESAAVRSSSFPLGGTRSALAVARSLRDAGRLDEAAVAYDAVLHPVHAADRFQVIHERALVAMALGRDREAQAAFRWLMRRSPVQRPLLHYQLGSFYRRQGRLEPAEREFEQSLARGAADVPERAAGCHYHLGEISLARGRHDEARRRFAAALEALPSHQRARERLTELAETPAADVSA